MPDVQSRHCRPAATEMLEYRSRPAVSVPPLARQPAGTRDRGDQVGPIHPVSHPFVERLIRTIRSECLDQVLFWNSLDLKRTLEEYRIYYNGSRVHQSLSGSTPEEQSGKPPPAHAALDSYGWQQHCRGLFQTPIAARLSIRHSQDSATKKVPQAYRIKK